MIEIVYPHRRASLSAWLLWPAALLVGGCMGVGAFYGAQTYRSDTNISVSAANSFPSTSPSASAYMLLPGSTPLPESIPTTEADVVVLPTLSPSPKVVMVPKPTLKPKPFVSPTPTAVSTAKPTSTPSAVPTPSPTPTATPNPLEVPRSTPHL